MQNEFSIKNVSITSFTIFFGIYIVLIGILYYVIFHKHHKRNKITIDELITLVARFYSRTIISTLLVMLGVFSIFVANNYKETRFDVISIIFLGITVTSVTIIDYIFYIKNCLKDLNPEVREENRKATLKIGEILEFILFTLFILMPIWRIPYFIELVPYKKKLIFQLIKTFAISITSLFLLFTLNPINIKERLNGTYNKENTKDKENNDNKNSEKEENHTDKK